jgi:hypothetical protein
MKQPINNPATPVWNSMAVIALHAIWQRFQFQQPLQLL